MALPGAKPGASTSSSSGLPGAAASASSGGLPGAKPSGGGSSKKSGGLLGVGKSLLGEIGEFISAPQQALFKGVRGVGQIASGDVRQGVGTLGSAGKSAAMFTLPGSSALLEEKAPVTATQALQPFGVNKLPRGLDTGLTVVADPLNVLTAGVGSLAKQALKVAGPELAEQIAKQGLRKGLTAAEKSALKDALVSHAAKEGARNPSKTAARQFKALSARGRGGIGVRIPGTGLGAPIIPGTALGTLGEATGATAAKNLVKGSRPVRALGRGLIPLRAASEAVGSAASEKLGTAARRRSRSAATLAEDWDKRIKAAKDDYAAQAGKAFEEADDEFVHAVLEAGPEAMDAAKAARPELARTIDTFDAVRREQADMQRARGLLLTEDEVRAGVTARKQAPVRGRMAARDDEIESLRTAGTPDPVPRSAAQERAAGKLAERTRRREVAVQGEQARGERLLAAAGREVAQAQTRAANRTGQVVGRARGRLEEAGQLETGLAARQRAADLKARRLAREANAADARAAELPDPKPAKVAKTEASEVSMGRSQVAGKLVDKTGREIGPDEVITLYHGTTPENAALLKRQGFTGTKTQRPATIIESEDTARALGKRVGDPLDYEPGRGQGGGAYLAATADEAKTFGEVIVPVRVKVSDLSLPPERAALARHGDRAPVQALLVGDGYTEVKIPASAVGDAPKPKLTAKQRAESSAAAKGHAADEARAEANQLKGIGAAPTRAKVQSDINLDAQRANAASRAETGTTTRLLGQAADEQRKAVAKAQKRLDAAKSQEQQTIARFDLENAQRAERAVDRRINTLVERNLRDEDTLARIAQDVLDDPNIITDDRYLHRVMTPEGLKALKGIEEEVRRRGGSVNAALNQASLKMRTVAREYTSNQINDAIRVIHEGGTVGDVELDRAVRGIAQQLNPGEKLYKESATLSLLDRGDEAAKAIAAADFVKELRGIVDDTNRAILLSADDVAAIKLAGGELPDDMVEFTIGKLGTFHAHKAVKAEIAGALGRLEDPDGLRKVFDNLDKWWRSQVTASLPGGIPFATRNARTNVMLMWLSGTNVPKYMREGLKLQRSVSRVYSAHAADVADLGVDAAMRKHLDPRDFKVWDYARKNGVIGDGFYQVDLGGLGGISKEGGKLKRAVRFGFGTHGAAAVKGRKLNSWIEEHARLSQFLSDVDRYGDLETALHRTQDVLFDYGALTPTERKIKRWGMPFYTFARKNLPGQVRRFIESPGRVALPEKLAAATTDPLPEGSPEYQARQGSRLSKVPGLLGMVTSPERPLHAAAEALDPAFQLATGRGMLGLRGALSSLGGVPGAPVKAAGEQAVGRSLFTGFNLPQAADERQRIALQTAVPSLSRAWPVVTRLGAGELRPSTEAQRNKLEAPGMAQALAMLGVNLQPVNEKERKRQARLARAAKAAEKG